MSEILCENRFDEYLNSCKKYNIHPKINTLINSNMPTDMLRLPNIIYHGPKGIGKYSQVLLGLKKYSPTELKYEKKLTVIFNKLLYYFKVSDIHIEIDMSLLGCNAKLLWNELYTQMIDIACVKSNKSLIIVCKNFQDIHSELLDIFYSYMQTLNYMNIKLIYILITNHISFIPDNIINISKKISIGRPNKSVYNRCISNINMTDIDINDISNIKSIQLDRTLMNPHEITCNKIISYILDYKHLNFTALRESCYDILIYHLDVYECVWYIFRYVIKNNMLTGNKINNVSIKMYTFFKYYNNNYRPIYHLENYILYLISEIYDLNKFCKSV